MSRRMKIVLAGVGAGLLVLCACLVIASAAVLVAQRASRLSGEPTALFVEPDGPGQVAAGGAQTEVPAGAGTVPGTPTATPLPAQPTGTPAAGATATVAAENDAEATPVPRPDNLDQVDFTVFNEAWRIIQDQYDGPLPTRQELAQAITTCTVELLIDSESDQFTTYYPAADQSTRPDDLDQVDTSLFNDTWHSLQQEHNGPLPTQEQLRETAIGCSIAATIDDVHTTYISPEAAAFVRENFSGSFEGIGAFVQLNDDGFVEIVRPIEGGPAEAAGVLAGDLIVGVDGEDVTGQSLDEVVAKVRGPRGTEVRLTIQRGDQPHFDVSITRDRIEIPVLQSEMLEGNIAYVQLNTFSSPNVEAQLKEALTGLLAQNPIGLILDLRDNPGGFLNQAVLVADIFLPESVVLFERNNTGFDRTYSAHDGDMAETIPLAVLVNAGSASASEIMAGAIKDNGRGVVIGEVTFGKGSVQLPNDLSDGGQLNVTIARWYTPNNQNIDAQGITPDIEVALPTDPASTDDTQLQRAVEYLSTGQ